MSKYMKGLAALVGALVSLAVVHFGLDVDVDAVSASLMMLINTAAVVFAPKNAE